MTSTRARPLPADQRRSAIVAAALPLVLAHGRSVTTRQIAHAAGISEGTIFHVFPDKDGVIQAVVESVLQPGQVAVDLAAIDWTTPLHPRIVAIVEILRRRMTEVFELTAALGLPHTPQPAAHGTTAGHRSHGSHHDHRRARMRELSVVIEDLLRPSADQLRFSPEESTRMIRLFTFAASHPDLTDQHPLPATKIADVLLHGIAAHPHRRTTGGRSC